MELNPVGPNAVSSNHSSDEDQTTVTGSTIGDDRTVPTISIDDGYVYVDGVQTFQANCNQEDQSLTDLLYSIGSKVFARLRPTRDDDQISEGRQDTKHLGTKAQSLLEQQTRCSLLRAQARPMRSQLTYERQEQQRCLAFVLESVQEAMSAFQTESSVSSNKKTNLSSNRKLVDEDHERLQSQTRKLEGLEIALSNLEFRLQQQEEFLEQRTRDFVHELRSTGICTFDVSLDVSTAGVDSTSSSNGADPILANFYDKLGDAKVLHERLVEFEDEYNEARSRIVLEEDHDQVPEVSLDGFDKESSQKRRELQTLLNQACEAAESARIACLDAGLDPEAYKTALAGHDLVDRASTMAQDVSSDDGNENTPRERGIHPFKAIEDSQELVQSWRENVPSLEADFDSMTIRRRHSDSSLQHGCRVGIGYREQDFNRHG